MFDAEHPPELETVRWLNTKKPLSLSALKGRVVVLHAFQMLCPGCVSHGLPQMRRIAQRFHADEVAAIGLHTVFEHHDVMTPAALEAFIHEYRWPFPVAVDAPDGQGPPLTMRAYEMRGTPTLLLFDRRGRLRRHYFGQIDDLRIGAEIMALALEGADAPREAAVAIEGVLSRVIVEPEHHGHHHDHVHGDGCGCEVAVE
ncbi:MAG: TlpA family protein disulfide reductase [Hyphomicrobiaceae bacterium]|nr:TlpA family protein disulfide reductase [Hyphomicrobiaceae bacterium]